MFWLCGGLLLLRALLFSDEADFHPGIFVVIEAHLSIVLIIVLVLKESDPLGVSAHATVINYCLRDADTTKLVLTVD